MKLFASILILTLLLACDYHQDPEIKSHKQVYYEALQANDLVTANLMCDMLAKRYRCLGNTQESQVWETQSRRINAKRQRQ